MVSIAVWATTFTATAVVRLSHAGTVAAVAILAGYVVPIVFARRYPAVVRARYAGRPEPDERPVDDIDPHARALGRPPASTGR